MELSGYSIDELKKLQIQIADEINNRKANEKKKVIEELAALAAAKGFALDELLGKARGTKAPAKGGKVAAKYRDKTNPELTWTGRGRKPAWVVQWLASGKSLGELAI